MAADIIDRIGGLRPDQNTGVVAGLRSLRLGAGYSMAPEGSVETLARTGMKYGIGNQGDPSGFPASFAQLMTSGQAQGADVKDLLGSIDTSISSLVQTGVKLDLTQTQGWSGFLQQMMTSGSPLAHAGILGGDVVKGFGGLLNNPLKSNASAFMISSVIGGVNWNDPDAVKRMTGRSPNEIMSSGSSQQQNALQVLQQSPRSVFATMAAKSLISTPEGLKALTENLDKVMPGKGPMMDFVRAQSLGSLLGGDATMGFAVRDAYRNGKVPRIPNADQPAEGTVNIDNYRNRVDAFSEELHGARTDFMLLGDKVHLVTDLFQDLANAVAKQPGMPADAVARAGGGGGGLFGNFSPGRALFGSGKESGFFGNGALSTAGGWIRSGLNAVFGAGSAHAAPMGRGLGLSGGLGRGGGSDITSGALFESISKAEGTFGNKGIDYNATYKGRGYGPPPKPLTEMTLAEVQAYAQTLPAGTAPVGAFQIQGRTTLPDVARRLGLDPNTTKFTPETQRSMAAWLAKNRGTGQWQGFESHPAELARARAALIGDDAGGPADMRKLHGGNKGWPFPVQSGAAALPANTTGSFSETGPGWGGHGASPPRSYANIPPPRGGEPAWATEMQRSGAVATSISSGDETGSATAGGGAGSSSLSDAHEAFGVFGRIVRETADHLHELGHASKRATSGMGSGGGGGPNGQTQYSGPSAPAAYP
jgi:hypothetical protein